MFSAKTRDTHRSSIIDWLPDRRQIKNKTDLQLLFSGRQTWPWNRDPMANYYNPTYTTSLPLSPSLIPSISPSLSVSFTLLGSGVCCNLHLTLALLAVIVAFVAIVFWPVSAWTFSSCFHYTLWCHRSTVDLLIFCHYYALWILLEKGKGGALTPRLLSRYLHLRQAQSLNEACKQRENFT